ncbi:50S ribosomal protein L4 [Pedosphaera parvula]|uniref:Large ribosomal subunit protein uL4 n=1 Tax=Pedosphaera parvula (strain Ellin514) TaxID=320771 RepID=B9XFN0_PEDPL|nr:50S ribosomal protein L4 [Pedosphaera parvula]EEF61394.1 ribosomal protein L4/L1e [Pedosphaera parvula Ellin514]
MKLKIQDIKGNSQGEMDVKFSLVTNGRGTQAVHDAVVAYRAAQRSGTACAKTVGEVAGSNKKPWKQKGTGRARAGSVRSPLWRGGGVVFGPRPRDFSKKISRSTKQLAFRKALTERLNAGDVLVVDNFKLASAKTKEFVGVLTALKVEGTALVVADALDANLSRASRNVAKVEVATSDSVNTYQILRSDKLVFTRSAFEKVEERLGKE